MKIAIIIPVFNESERINKTIKDILVNSKRQIIVVNDGSTDDTLMKVKSKFGGCRQVEIVSHEINLGKGAAMKTGAEKAWEMGMEAIIFMDGDGQHNPKYLADFTRYLNQSDLVFGYRSLNKNMPLIRKLLNRIASLIFKAFFNIRRKDLLCGFFGIKKNVYKIIEWNSAGYEVEMEIATRVGKNKINFKEVKIKTVYVKKVGYTKGMNIWEAMKISRFIPLWYFLK